jgi:hypothetical protein
LEYLQWRKGLHSCGHHISETLSDPSHPRRDVFYQAEFEECLACKEIGAAQHMQAKDDEPKIKQGQYVPVLARMWRAIRRG